MDTRPMRAVRPTRHRYRSPWPSRLAWSAFVLALGVVGLGGGWGIGYLVDRPTPKPAPTMSAPTVNTTPATAAPVAAPTVPHQAPRAVAAPAHTAPATTPTKARPAAPVTVSTTPATAASSSATPTPTPTPTPTATPTAKWTQADKDAADAACAATLGVGAHAVDTPKIGEPFTPGASYRCDRPPQGAVTPQP